MKVYNIWIVLGGLFGALGVFFGAFGAHMLSDTFTEDLLSTYNTAIQYQMYNAFALLIIGLMTNIKERKYLKYSGYAIVLGILLFSGSLYLLVLTNIKILGLITPFGGFSFIIGWLLIMYCPLARNNGSHRV